MAEFEENVKRFGLEAAAEILGITAKALLRKIHMYTLSIQEVYTMRKLMGIDEEILCRFIE